MLQDQVESTVKSETICTDISKVSTAFWCMLSKSLEHRLGFLAPKPIYLTIWSQLILAQAKVCDMQHATYLHDCIYHAVARCSPWSLSSFVGGFLPQITYSSTKMVRKFRCDSLRDDLLPQTPILCVISGLGLKENSSNLFRWVSQKKIWRKFKLFHVIPRNPASACKVVLP